MIVKRSVTGSIARALAGMVILSLIGTGLALVTLLSSQRDAEAINIAGSLRMQSYRLAWDRATHSRDLPTDLQHYQQSLDEPALSALEHFYVPAQVTARYRQLKTEWPGLRSELLDTNAANYPQQVRSYVDTLERFVLELQRYAELKMHLVVASSLVGFIAIITLAGWTIRQTRRQIVMPLNKLATASGYLQHGNFHYPALDTALPNELGVLASAFQRMAQKLQQHTLLLEQHAQQQQHQLILMEERAAIAEELHDALAQALSFLGIQLTLLKRRIGDRDPKAEAIIADLEHALDASWHQLRELLATFRSTH
ncbi:nitrate/nitrite two-component system sensor histidine kinase NarQ [Paramixta manurensis]|uniref:histidine kinase n=1 Tax=Paramixta manurensis TaxID=2740817 RepID=A0A6M8UBQ5_9GAMM|nr:nitrate/nitrite two-component system sensor histidine kinase NarQ [Erwiniaceae bacterium PD-1]